MPKETFWNPEATTSDDPRQFDVRWGSDDLSVTVAAIPFDRSGLNRLIRSLRKARDHTYGVDE